MCNELFVLEIDKLEINKTRSAAVRAFPSDPITQKRIISTAPCYVTKLSPFLTKYHVICIRTFSVHFVFQLSEIIHMEYVEMYTFI